MNCIVANATMLLKSFVIQNRFILLPAFLLSIHVTTFSQTTVIPVRYWTFNQSNAALDSTGNGNLDFSSYGSAYTHTTGNVGKYLTWGSTGNLTVGGNVTADTFLIVEFLFKPGALFNNTKFLVRTDGAIGIGFSYPLINFNTSHKSSAGATVSDNWTITLDGIDRKSYGYYVDGNWHHMLFKLDTKAGKKQLWVDGVLADGFSKNVSTGYISNTGGTAIYINSTVAWEKYFGSIDELAIYNKSVPNALIYKHYNQAINQHLPYSYLNDYTGTLPTAPADSTGIDINEFAPGHPTPNVTALGQMQKFPLPRYFPGNTLKKNFNWIEPSYFGGFVQPGISTSQAITNSVELQKEMVFNFNYSWIVMSNTTSYQNLTNSNSFESNWINTANLYPQYPAACIAFWAQLHPANAGYYSGGAYISSQNLPNSHYLRTSGGAFINPNGGTGSTKYWSPAAPHDSIIRDGLTQKFYLQQLLNKMTRPLNWINENGEVLPFHLQGALSQDPIVTADKNSSGLDWATYFGNRSKSVAQDYRNQFMTTLAGLSNTTITHYAIDGNASYRPKWSEYRQVNSQMNNMYYSTPDFYPRYPWNWLTGYSSWHGWRWIVDCRYNEIAAGDHLYSPFVSPGWSTTETDNIRPAQWLGLLKVLAVTGAEFYYTGFFNDASSYNPPNPPPANPSNYAWQAVMPSYAQGVTSRFENLLRSSTLMNGDKPNDYQGGTLPGYSFNAGDQRMLVSARKHNSQNKYIIAGTLQPNSNMNGNSELVKDAGIALGAGLNLQFKIRRQGSVYFFDNTNAAAPVFYQIDNWHESKHPYYWSGDFEFEAELYDNTTATNNILKTEVPAGTASGDFRNFTTSLCWNDTSVSFSTMQYNFQPRTAGKTYYLWVRAKSKNGTNTGVYAKLDNDSSKLISCITDTTYNWYRYDVCQLTKIKYPSLTAALHTLKLTPSNSKICIDKILLTTDSTMVLNAAIPTCAAGSTIITVGGSLTFCQGGSVNLSVSTGSAYLWSNGATTQNITVSTTGNYNATVYYSSGCASASDTAHVVVNAIPATSISASGPLIICSGNSVTLTANPTGTFLWSNGATTQSQVVNSAGSYRVTVTSAQGCSASSAITNVTVNTSPTVSITAGGPTTFCSGNSVTLTASAASTYTWSNGATTQSIIATASGNYAVTVTNASACTAVSSATTVTVNAIPSATISASGPTTFCSGGSVTLTASAASTYLWSNGATTQSQVVNATGSYRVTVTSAQGCSASSAITNVVVNTPPTASITADGPTTFCSGNSVTLTATAASTYLWSNGATTQSILATTSGNYAVTVSNASACTAVSSATTVTVNAIPSATISASGPTTFCTGGSVTLTASAALTYLWSNGATTQSIIVSTSGSYNVTLTNASACTAVSSPTIVTVNSVINASITANGPTTFCAPGSVTLTASPAGNYLWSNGNTTQSIIASASGTFTVTVSSNGCSGTSSPVTVTKNNSPTSTITASGPTSFCAGNNVILTASLTASYLWSNGATTQSIVANATGSYIVTVTNLKGCTKSSNPTAVNVNPVPSNIVTANGPLTFCEGNNVQLSVPSGNNYLWNNGATTSSVQATMSGNYVVTITNAFNCTSNSAPTPVIVNPVPVASISASGPSTFCAGSNVMLNINAASTYLWSNGITTQNNLISTTGTYSVTITNGFGCSDQSEDFNVNVLPVPSATVTANGPLSFCNGGYVNLSVPSGNIYLWSNGQTNNSVNINTSGNYIVTVTGINGCTSISDTQSVSVSTNPLANISLSQSPQLCFGDSIILSADSGASNYLWSNGATTSEIVTQTTGDYFVTVTLVSGCVSHSDTIHINVNPLPAANINANGPTTFCEGGSVELTSNSAATYLWNNGSTEQNLFATTSGDYAVVISDSNGCTATSNIISVLVNTNPVATISANGVTTFCEGGSVELISNSAATYLWNNGSTEQNLFATATGDYSVLISDTNGCTATSNIISVLVNTNPVATISANGVATFCEGGSVELTSNVAATYLWNNGSTEQNLFAATTGDYSVLISDTNGCTATSNIISVLVNAIPVATISANGATIFCEGGNVELTSNVAATYLWNNGSTEQNLFATATGDYSVLISDTNGCTSTSNIISVLVNAIPVATISANGATIFCEGDSVELTSNGAASYLWNNGSTEQNLFAAATSDYSVVISDSNGCTATSNIISVLVNAIPSATISANGATTFCEGDSVELVSNAAVTYLWNNGSTEQNLLATTSGDYSVVISDSNGCTATSNIISVLVNTIPVATISANGATTFCEGDSVVLTAFDNGTYLWNNGSTEQFITVNTTGNFYATLTNTNGCVSNTDTINVNVNAMPQTSISPSGVLVICPNTFVQITASANGSILWNTGDTSNSIQAGFPGIYTAFGTSNEGCTDSASVTVIYNPAITVNITASSTSICSGDSSMLTATGAVFYSWTSSLSLNNTTGNVLITAPSATTTYTVLGTNNSGCSATASITVNVKSLPTYSVSPLISTICPGNSIVITATPVTNSYNWTPATGLNQTTGSSVTASPGTSATYVVTATSQNGCSRKKNVTVTVACPAPSGLTSSVIDANNATLFWTAVPCAQSYKIQYKVNGTANWITILNVLTTSKTFTGLTAGTSYQWRVITKCPDGSFSAVSPTFTFTTPSARSAIQPVIDVETFAEVFPNPANNEINIMLNYFKQDKIKIRLLDASLRLLNEVNLNADEDFEMFRMNIDHLQRGIYHVVVSQDEYISNLRFVKM